MTMFITQLAICIKTKFFDNVAINTMKGYSKGVKENGEKQVIKMFESHAWKTYSNSTRTRGSKAIIN